MADIVSRAFKNDQYFAAANNLTSYFNTHFPLSQKRSWKEFQIPKKLASRVISCLRGELLPMASLLRLPKVTTNTGNIGNTMQPCVESTHSSEKHLHSNATSSLQHSLQGSGQELTAKDLKSRFQESRMRSHPSPRPSSWLENKAPCTGQKISTNYPSNDLLKGIKDKTR